MNYANIKNKTLWQMRKKKKEKNMKNYYCKRKNLQKKLTNFENI